jgi:tRNA-2-methylthio-N6-dimethylallyladenosine synthase
VIRDNPKVARHVHLPLQSGSDRILKRMNRHYTKEQFIELARRIREEIPDVSITTDIIVGFPGETAEDVAETLDVIERVGFDNAYTFIYSPRRGTPAAAMKDQVPAEEVKVNFDKVLSAVQRNAAMRAGALTGRIMEGLVEEVNERKEGYVTCRLSNNMVVHIPGDASMIGSYKPILLEQCRGFYFFGRIADTDSAADPQ